MTQANMAAPTQRAILAGQPVKRRLKIVNLVLPGDVQQRLLEMGLTIGTECSVVRYAPLGDPMEIKVRGYFLSLRKAEAEGIQVEVLEP
jgi:Fe2+ transport system protein FeoA